MSIKQVLKRIKLTVFPETWCCAVRFNRDASTCIINNTNDEFTIIPNTKRYWAADPFLYEKDGHYYLFFEMFDRLKRKGLIGCREISEYGFGDMNVIYEGESHLSYPYIFEKDGEVYIIPESNKAGELFRLKCCDFPNKWTKDKVISNERLADTTLFEKDGTTYYFSEVVDDSGIFDRLDLFYEENNHFISCVKNPVKMDIHSARCAGKVFEYNGSFIRPSQDCSNSYGEKINFNRVLSISKENYQEELLSTLSVCNLHLNTNQKFIGIHTYNKLNNVEIIDLKISGKFYFLGLIGIINKVFSLLLKRMKGLK